MKTKKYVIWIPDYTPPSLNKLFSTNHFARTRYKTEACLYVKKYVAGYGPFPALKSISYTFYFDDKRKRDNDNYCAKYLTDALRYSNVIADDNSHVTGPTTLYVEPHNPDKRKGTQIILEVIL